MAAAVFFQRGQVILDRSGLTDLFIHGHQTLTQLPEAVKLRYLALSLLQRGRRGERFGDRLTGHLAGQPVKRTVSRISVPPAMTVEIATTSAGRGD